MTFDQALTRAREWQKLLDDADMARYSDFDYAENLACEAADLYTEIERAGYSPDDLLSGRAKPKVWDDTGIVTDIPRIAKAIKVPVLKWPGHCHEIAGLIRQAKLVPATAKLQYGHWHGPISRDSLFAGRSVTHHGWLKLADGRIYDPTRWAFAMTEPAIFLGEDPEGWYDFGGNKLHEMMVDCSKPPAPEGKRVPVPNEHRGLLSPYLGSKHVVTEVPINQLMWLGNLPPARFGADAKPVFAALVTMGFGAFIPRDNREAVLGS